MIVVGLSALFVGLDQGVDRGWGDGAALGLIGFSLAVLALFLVNESRASAPILKLAIFADRFFSQSCAAAFLAFFAMISAMILTPFYLQDVRGFSPEAVGLVMMSMPAAMLVVAPLAGWISDRTGPRLPATFGVVLTGCGLLLLGGLSADTATGTIVRNLVLIGVGMGFFGSPNSSAILSSVPREEVGTASGLSALMRTAGIAFGIAFAATAFTFFRDRAVAAAPLAVDKDLYLRGLAPVFVLAASIAGLNVLNSLTRGRHR
jgi:MFS family permease